MSNPNPSARYQLDLSSNSCRIRIDGTKAGKFIKVLIRDSQNPAASPLHGTGVLSDDLSVFTATFASEQGEQTLVSDWRQLRAELATYPRYD